MSHAGAVACLKAGSVAGGRKLRCMRSACVMGLHRSPGAGVPPLPAAASAECQPALLACAASIRWLPSIARWSSSASGNGASTQPATTQELDP